MPQGKDTLADRFMGMLWQAAGEGSRDVWTKQDFRDALQCADSPTFKDAVKYAMEAGVLTHHMGYVKGRYTRFYALSDAALAAAVKETAS